MPSIDICETPISNNTILKKEDYRLFRDLMSELLSQVSEIQEDGRQITIKVIYSRFAGKFNGKSLETTKREILEGSVVVRLPGFLFDGSSALFGEHNPYPGQDKNDEDEVRGVLTELFGIDFGKSRAIKQVPKVVKKIPKKVHTALTQNTGRRIYRMDDTTQKPNIDAVDDNKISSFFQGLEGWKRTLLRNIEIRITKIGWKKSDFTLGKRGEIIFSDSGERKYFEIYDTQIKQTITDYIDRYNAELRK